MSSAEPVCPECGASLRDGRTCQEIFDSFLVLEFEDPAYGAVHFFTVACFYIQHNRYSDEGLRWINATLRESLADSSNLDNLYRRAQTSAQNTSRRWKVNRVPGAPKLPQIDWQMTIGDVASQYQDAASYCALIRQWAETVLRQMWVPPL